MGRREAQEQAQAEQDFKQYVQNVTTANGTHTNHAEQLQKLADLRRRGDITEEEYQRAKDGILV
jgi:hypothetical protein